jgi:hypothetical protein
MLRKTLISAIAAASAVGLSACASPTTSERHNHNRDAKQGTAYPVPASDETAKKPLHDHREMK